MGKTRLKATISALVFTSITARTGWHLGTNPHPVSITLDLIVLALIAWGIYYFMRAAYKEQP